MTFSVFVPEHAAGARLPVVWYLSGLTCTHANLTEKGEYRAACAALGLVFVAPDTSPRGEGVPGDPDGAYNVGLGAGFYVDATEAPWAEHYRMWSYLTEELPALVSDSFPADARRQSVLGHSMGGHGALTIGLTYPSATAQSRHLLRSLRHHRFRGARRRSAAISEPIALPGASTTPWR